MHFEKKIKSSLSAIEINHGDVLDIEKTNGKNVRLNLVSSDAYVTDTTLANIDKGKPGGHTNFKFHCDLDINGTSVRIEREVASQKSFYEPLRIEGLNIWLDGVNSIFNFLKETHGPCRPGKDVRLAFQEASLSIAPVKLHPWCPLPPGCLRIEDCYNGEDCWLGAFHGNSAHGGLDINHPSGTPLYAPFDLDDQYRYNRVENGDYNNRWRAYRRWEDGSQWMIMSSHMLKMFVPDHQPVKAGEQYAEGAGVAVHGPGSHEHSHFGFGIVEGEGIIYLDPWILFRQMYLDNS